MLFIALRLLPSFLTFSESWVPQLKPRRVPLEIWGMQVLVLTTGSLLNNWAFAYKVPLTILIVIRSAGKGSNISVLKHFESTSPRSSGVYAFRVSNFRKAVFASSDCEQRS